MNALTPSRSFETDARETASIESIVAATVALWRSLDIGGPRYVARLAAALDGCLSRKQRFHLLMAAALAADHDDAREIAAAILRAGEERAP